MPLSYSGDSGSPQPDVSVYRRLDAEMGSVLYWQAFTGARVGIVLTAVVGLLMSQVYPFEKALLWAIALEALYIVRYLWLLRALRLPRLQRQKRGRDLWLNALVGACGIGWGTTPWIFGSAEHPISHGVLMFTLAGVMGFVPQNLTAGPLATRLFVIPLTLSLICQLALQGTQTAWVMILTVMVFFTVAMSSARHFYLNLRHMLLLRIEKEQLVRTLTEAKDRAEEAASAKSEFLATMSHEIRTPMNGLLGMLEVLNETELNHQQLNYVTTASRSAESLLDLLNDILDYSKIEVGRLELENIPFDWLAMVGEIAIINRVLAVEKGIGFHLDIPVEGSSIVMGDPTRLRQILNNLLSNALKFTHEGNVYLQASYAAEDDTSVTLNFIVRDSGIGIEPEAQGKLFQQFQQADVSMSRKYGGTGLGLSISQRLAQMMDGGITFTSEYGKGSEFVLTVKFKKADTGVQPAATSAGTIDLANRSHVRTLIVDDDAVSQRVAVLMLKSFGLNPTVVDNGTAAVEAVCNDHYDLVFMDCQLPGMDGFEAAREIRRNLASHSPTRPVIVGLSGRTRSEDREAALGSGMDDYLTKPLRKREMRMCLERWIEREHLERHQQKHF